MAYKEVSRVDIAEVIRRWQKGNSQRHIASGVGLSRDTVRKYLGAAKEAGISREGPDPTEEQLSRLAALSRTGPRKAVAPAEGLLEPWGDQIYRWITVDRLQVTRIRELLDQRGCQVSYTSLRRFLQRRNWRGRSARTVRMEQSGPGEVAELDFGRLGVIQDQETGRRCTVWALIVVLAYSRHSFLWPTYSQKLEEVIAGLEAAWAFFGGIPQYLVIDNFPAAVAGADALHPKLTRGFLEYSQHRGFITDPARVRHPKDKPRVERGVQYVRERFFKGSDFKDLAHLRDEAARWCRDVAGLRTHGTTRRQPLQVFVDEELRILAPWDGEPYEVTDWRTAKVHPDHHVACQYALYSVPSALCPPGQRVEIGLDAKLVRIYHQGRLVKVHPSTTVAHQKRVELGQLSVGEVRLWQGMMMMRWRRWPSGPQASNGCMNASPDVSGVRSQDVGRWTICGDCSVRWSARTAGNWPSRLGMPHRTGCSACCTATAGMLTWSGTT